MAVSSTSTSRRYVPPHLRNRPQSNISQAGQSSSTESSRNPSPTRHRSDPHSPLKTQTAPARSQSRTPWAPHPTSWEASSSSSSRTHSRERQDPTWTRHEQSAPARGNAELGAKEGAVGGGITSSKLHVFGDSFVGPLKLLEEDCVKITTFKGASAKVIIPLLTVS